MGADAYYTSAADDYSNPHYAEIERLLTVNAHRIGNPDETVLDFSAGSGEVSRVLMQAGFQQVSGSDPYTWALYEKQVGKPCLKLSFSDVIQTGLPQHYKAIVSSFALHLCPMEQLPALIWRLFEYAPLLVVITPHKRPELEKIPGITLMWEDFTCTPRGKKVRMRAFSAFSYY